MKINYENGGYFNLKEKSIEVNGKEIKADYQILIDSVINNRN